MTPSVDGWTVVLVGQWNPAVFNPEWVGRNLNEGRPVTAELAAGLGLLALAGWRVVLDELVVIPSRDRLTVGARATSDAALQRVEEATRRILELLPHTPLLAAGINFTFVETAPAETTLDLVRSPDLGRFAEAGLGVVSHALHRTVRSGEEMLNTVVTMAEDGKIHASVNIHRDLSQLQPEQRAASCREALRGKLTKAREEALGVLRAVYGLELMEEAA